MSWNPILRLSHRRLPICNKSTQTFRRNTTTNRFATRRWSASCRISTPLERCMSTSSLVFMQKKTKPNFMKTRSKEFHQRLPLPILRRIPKWFSMKLRWAMSRPKAWSKTMLRKPPMRPKKRMRHHDKDRALRRMDSWRWSHLVSWTLKLSTLTPITIPGKPTSAS